MTKSVKISIENYKWLFDHRNCDDKTVDEVIGMLIEYYTKR